MNEKLLHKIIPNDSENCINWLGNGNSGMDAVAQANPNVYTQLSCVVTASNSRNELGKLSIAHTY